MPIKRRQLNAHAWIFCNEFPWASRCLLAGEWGAVMRVRLGVRRILISLDGMRWANVLHQFLLKLGDSQSEHFVRFINSPAHSSYLIKIFLAKQGFSLIRQLPYSSDMAPCDFWLFPKLKVPLKISGFESRIKICRMRLQNWTLLKKDPFRSIFDSGRTGGLSVWRRKGA